MASTFLPSTGLGGGSSLFGNTGSSSFGMTGPQLFGSTTAPSSTLGPNSTTTGAPGFQSNITGIGNNANNGFSLMAANPNALTEKINSRCTVRHLTSLIPQWKGHFDVADMVLSAQEKSIARLRLIVDKLTELDEACKTSHENIKNSLNGINLMHEKLQNEVNERCKRQDAQNIISIKARRLSESLVTAGQSSTYRIHPAFRVPNHLNLQLSKELLDTIRLWKREIHGLQLEVLSLKDIDMTKYVPTVKSVLRSHERRISAIGKCLTNGVTVLDSTSKDRNDLWNGVVDKPGGVKRAFVEALMLPVTLPTDNDSAVVEPHLDTSNEVKKQLQYLRRFNSAFSETGKASIDSSTYTIREILQQQIPGANNTGAFGTTGQTTSLFGGGLGTTAPSFGSGTLSGSSNLFGNSTIGTQGSSLFGSTATGSQGANLMGSNAGGNKTGSLFGNTGSTGTNLFGTGAAGTTGSNLFGSANTTNTGATTSLFGNSNTNTSGGSTLFGPSSNTANNSANVFGKQSSNLFGQQNTSGGFGQQQQANTSNIFGSTTSTGGGLFGQGTTNTVFGQPTTSSNSTFGTNTTHQSTNAGLFGQQNSTGLFGQSSGSSLGNQQGSSKSTALVPYNPGVLGR